VYNAFETYKGIFWVGPFLHGIALWSTDASFDYQAPVVIMISQIPQ